MTQNKAKNNIVSARAGIIRDGAAAAWPICLGYLPLGLAMGVLAQQVGMPAWLTALMSLAMFSGMQIIAVALVADGAAIAAITLAIFVVNLRYALMSSALAVHFPGVGRLFLLGYSAGITDETFVVNLARFQAGGWDRWRAFAVNNISYLSWILATVAGSLLGQFIPKGAFGIDYVLPAMFICLLVLQLKNRLMVLTAVASMAIAVLWKLFVPGNTYIIAGAIGGATLGFFVRRTLAKHGEKRGPAA